MISFSPWLLPALLLGVWCLWAFAATAELRAKELRLSIPKDQRGGVSILPVIPLFPLLFWGVAWLMDAWASPWGTVAIGTLHIILMAMMGFTFVRDLRYYLCHERN